MSISKTKTASLIAQAQKTDLCGNTLVVSYWKLDTGVDRIAVRTTANKMPHCLSSCYLGLHNEGTAGARRDVTKAVVKSKNSNELARNLNRLGFTWKANTKDILQVR